LLRNQIQFRINKTKKNLSDQKQKPKKKNNALRNPQNFRTNLSTLNFQRHNILQVSTINKKYITLQK